MFRRLLIVSNVLLSLTSIFAAPVKASGSKPYKVSIAILGPHQSLLDIVSGIESKAKVLGLDVTFDIQHVNFDMTQIPKMLTAFKAKKPDLIVAITTSVAQHAKTVFRGTKTPIVFAAITDPVEAKLISIPNQADGNITGVSDKQDARTIITFIQHTVPTVKRIGIPYSQNEANDRALVDSFKAAAANDVTIVPIPVDSLQDLPQRIRSNIGNIDAVYVGPSNMIQPALPVIVQQANQAKLPVFNFNEAAVLSHQALGSCSVSYVQLGHAVAEMIQSLMNSTAITMIKPKYPEAKDHYGTVSKTVAQRLGIKLPEQPAANVTYVGQ